LGADGVTPFAWDKFSLYELCAQNPPRDARVLRAIYEDRRVGLAARRCRADLILGEDFCGTAAISRAWCDLLPRGRAIGVDNDAPTLARAREMCRDRPRVELVRADVLRAKQPADLIAALNFSICEFHERPRLIKYLRHAHSRLRRAGCLVCDLYGGSDAFETGLLDQRIKPPPAPHSGSRDRITYSWEQRSADPLTGHVVNAMHFEVTPPHGGGRKPLVFLNAFVYDWRLWSVPELRDAMTEAGFASTQVYPRTAEAKDAEGNLYVRPVEDPTELGESFNVFVVGRA
jgi:SAM-dependent methyltransferase